MCLRLLLLARVRGCPVATCTVSPCRVWKSTTRRCVTCSPRRHQARVRTTQPVPCVGRAAGQVKQGEPQRSFPCAATAADQCSTILCGRPRHRSLKVQSSCEGSQAWVEGATLQAVSTASEAVSVLARALRSRAVGATDCNARSSRSHWYVTECSINDCGPITRLTSVPSRTFGRTALCRSTLSSVATLMKPARARD